MSMSWVLVIVFVATTAGVYLFHLYDVKQRQKAFNSEREELNTQIEQAYSALFPRIVVDSAYMLAKTISLNDDIEDVKSTLSHLSNSDFISEISLYSSNGEFLASTDLTKQNKSLPDEEHSKYKNFSSPTIVSNTNNGRTVRVVAPSQDSSGGGIILEMDIAN